MSQSPNYADLSVAQLDASSASIGQLNASQLQAAINSNGLISGLGMSGPATKTSNPFSEALRQHEQAKWSSEDAKRRLELEAKNAEIAAKRAGLAIYKEMYIKLRCDNIALSHENAIELVKMIRDEAETLVYDDFK